VDGGGLPRLKAHPRTLERYCLDTRHQAGEWLESRSMTSAIWTLPAVELQCGSLEVIPTASNSVVRARIDERTKREAATALKKIGLTLSDAFRLLLVRVAAEKALPFEPLNRNAETVAAMKAARRGELVKVGKPDKLMRSLTA
jgi:DNA-damage-inducible protein J